MPHVMLARSPSTYHGSWVRTAVGFSLKQRFLFSDTNKLSIKHHQEKMAKRKAEEPVKAGKAAKKQPEPEPEEDDEDAPQEENFQKGPNQLAHNTKNGPVVVLRDHRIAHRSRTHISPLLPPGPVW